MRSRCRTEAELQKELDALQTVRQVLSTELAAPALANPDDANGGRNNSKLISSVTAVCRTEGQYRVLSTNSQPNDSPVR